MKPFHLTFRMGLLIVTGVLITVTGILFRQQWYRILPLYVSLFIMLLQTQANRYAFLLGGLNSILYAVVYFSLQMYGSAWYALLFSFPLQIVTFINWRRHAYGKSTVLRRMTVPQRWLAVGIFFVSWIALNLAMSGTDASLTKRLLDNASSVLGIMTTIASMLSLMEYPAMQLISVIVGSPIYVLLLIEDPAQTTYAIYHVYSAVCVCMSYRTVRALYSHQQEELNHID